MADAGLLTAIFPEIETLKGCFQNRHHCYDVFVHTMKAYCHLETILNDCNKILPESAGDIFKCMDANRAALLKCAVLLHDIGKPLRRTLDSRKNVHFCGHAHQSADMAKKISARLKFSTREKHFIDIIIRNHTRPLLLFLAHQGDTLTSRGKTRFFMRCKDDTPAVLLHSMADTMGKTQEYNKEKEAFLSFAKETIHDFFSNFNPKTKEPPLITGNDLINEFGLTPSPLFTTILNLVQEARLSNKIISRQAALTLVEEYFGLMQK